VSVFVDTSALYALIVAEDVNHQAATSCFEELRALDAVLVSTNYVLLECASLIQRRQGFEAAKSVLARIGTLLDVLWIDQQAHHQAVQLWSRARSRALSLVDCASFVVMHAHGIRRAVAFDAHFIQTGFEMLPKSGRVAEPRGVYRVGRRSSHAKTH
jgi:predicted nucleic acid-binding protein